MDRVLPSENASIRCLWARWVNVALGSLVVSVVSFPINVGDYRVPQVIPYWETAPWQLEVRPTWSVCCLRKIVAPVMLPLPLQHPRAVDTQDACMQVIPPCYAWGEAWQA